MKATVLLVSAAAGAGAAGIPAAQWSPMPASHLAIADSSAAQEQPKLAARTDGGTYVGFFDSDPNGSPPFGFDVRLQRLDAGGRELWPHGGVLVADRGFSSTQDYGLATDAAGNALLTFRDDRGGGTQITAAKVDPAGNVLFQVRLTATTQFVAAPKIAGASDGDIVVAWAQDTDVRVQRLDPTGSPRWASDLVLPPPTGSFAASDLRPADGGSVVLALQHSTGGFSAPRHLRAQKIDAAGNLLWQSGHVPVFDGGSLQIGNFPTFAADGAGGAVFAWYSVSPLECRVQRLDAAGVEVFAHDGVAVSTDTTRGRTAPSLVFDAATRHVVVAYRETNAAQSMAGVSAQRIDAAGNRLWSATGRVLVPLGAAAITDVTAVAVAGAAVAVVWSESPGFAQDRLRAAILDAGGTPSPTLELSSTPATKFRVAGARSSFGYAVFAWRDDAAGNPDILAQNLLPDGSLGGVASAAVRSGRGVNPLAFASATPPALGTIWTTTVAHPASTAWTAMILAAAAAAGPILPGFGELLLDPATVVFQQGVASTGSSDTYRVPVPADLRLIGLFLAGQAAIGDSGGVRLTNAVDVVLGL